MSDTFLGIDYGEKNTGLAFGRSGLVMPLKVLDSRDENTLLAEIARTVIENKVSKLVLGLPLNLDGKDTQQSLKVRKFSKILKIRVKRPVDFVSEFDTTNEAMIGAIRSGISKKRRATNDHISAAIILKRYFSEKE